MPVFNITLDNAIITGNQFSLSGGDEVEATSISLNYEKFTATYFTYSADGSEKSREQVNYDFVTNKAS